MPTKKKHQENTASKPVAQRLSLQQIIGQRIKEHREGLGLNFEQLAALTREEDEPTGQGIAAVTLRRYERNDEGASLPGLREIVLLSRAFDVPADLLLTGKDPREVSQKDRQGWQMFKDVVNLAASESNAVLPGASSARDAYKVSDRQEKLKRARLHTKLQRDKD